MFPLKDNIPNDRFPVVTVALVVINVIAYLLSIRHGGSFFGGPGDETVVHDAAIPYDFTHPGDYCTRAPVEAFDPFKTIAFEPEALGTIDPAGLVPTAVVAVGLALRKVGDR